MVEAHNYHEMLKAGSDEKAAYRNRRRRVNSVKGKSITQRALVTSPIVTDPLHRRNSNKNIDDRKLNEFQLVNAVAAVQRHVDSESVTVDNDDEQDEYHATIFAQLKSKGINTEQTTKSELKSAIAAAHSEKKPGRSSNNKRNTTNGEDRVPHQTTTRHPKSRDGQTSNRKYRQ
jgi:hypothetical protein